MLLAIPVLLGLVALALTWALKTEGGTAYVLALLIHQGGRMLGFG